MSTRPGTQSILTIVLIGIVWGLNWPALKIILIELPPFTIRAIAFPAAATLLSLIALATGQKMRPSSADVLPIFYTGLFLVFGFNVITTFGQLLTDASRAVLIAYSMPALTAVLAVVFLREKLTLPVLAALLLSLTGIGLLLLEEFTTLTSSGLQGILVMLLAALSWAIGNVLLKAHRWSVSALVLTVWFFVAASIVITPLVFVFESPWQQSWPSAKVMLLLLYHVLGPMVFCYWLWTNMLERLPVTIAAISTLTAPVVGFTSAAVILNESISRHEAVALLLIISAIVFTLLPHRAAQHAPD